MGTFFLRPGSLDNRHDPVRLGVISDYRNPVVSALVLAENVDRDDRDMVTLRWGRTVRYAGAPHSFWTHPQDDQIGYFVEASVLKKLNLNYTSTVVATLQNNLPLSYEVVNGEIVLSNTDDIGWVYGTQFAPFAPTLSTFELAMPAGQRLALDHGDGCLLVARGSVIYRSKPFNAEVRDARLSEYPMNGYVRMLACVEDGWWVGTDKHVGFVARDGADNYTFRYITDNPPPDGAFFAGWENTENGRRRFVVWASVDGFCRGRAGGVFENLSENVALPAGTSGHVFSRNFNGIDQYIAVIRDPTGAESFTAPTLTINTISV